MGFFSRLLGFLRKKPVAITLSFTVTVLALWIAVRGVDLEQAFWATVSIPLWPLFVAFLFLIVGTLIRGVRWHLLMRRQGSTFGASLEAILVSIFFNGLLPLRSGEVIRIGYFSRRTGAPFMSTAGALFLERSLDLTSLALIGAIFLSGFAGREIPDFRVPPWILGAAAGAAVAGMFAFGFWLRFRKKRGGQADHQSRLARWFDEGVKGFSALESKSEAAMVIGLSLAMWIITIAPGIYVYRGVGVDVSFTDIAVIMVVVTFFVAAPSSPGFVGTYHAGFVLASGLVGIPKEKALPVAIVTHLISQIPFILAGGIVLATGGRRALAKRGERKNSP